MSHSKKVLAMTQLQEADLNHIRPHTILLHNLGYGLTSPS
jgi:hypothetical protein